MCLHLFFDWIAWLFYSCLCFKIARGEQSVAKKLRRGRMNINIVLFYGSLASFTRCLSDTQRKNSINKVELSWVEVSWVELSWHHRSSNNKVSASMQNDASLKLLCSAWYTLHYVLNPRPCINMWFHMWFHHLRTETVVILYMSTCCYVTSVPYFGLMMTPEPAPFNDEDHVMQLKAHKSLTSEPWVTIFSHAFWS